MVERPPPWCEEWALAEAGGLPAFLASSLAKVKSNLRDSASYLVVAPPLVMPIPLTMLLRAFAETLVGLLARRWEPRVFGLPLLGAVGSDL